jgi:hypothetical protein
VQRQVAPMENRTNGERNATIHLVCDRTVRAGFESMNSESRSLAKKCAPPRAMAGRLGYMRTEFGIQKEVNANGAETSDYEKDCE